jgi:hypothetical protein
VRMASRHDEHDPRPRRAHLRCGGVW